MIICATALKKSKVGYMEYYQLTLHVDGDVYVDDKCFEEENFYFLCPDKDLIIKTIDEFLMRDIRPVNITGRDFVKDIRKLENHIRSFSDLHYVYIEYGGNCYARLSYKTIDEKLLDLLKQKSEGV
jgi:hypothetical protein